MRLRLTVRHPGLRLIVFGVVNVLLARPAPATTVIGADFSELVTEASTIVRGRVVDVRAEWVGNRERIDTLVTLAADDYCKGGLGRQVVFQVPGGRLGRYRSVLIGAPAFSIGQEVILFLSVRGSSVPFVLGLNQGVFRIRSLTAGGQVVTPTPLMARGDQPERVVRGDASRPMLDVSGFVALVRSILGRQSGHP